MSSVFDSGDMTLRDYTTLRDDQLKWGIAECKRLIEQFKEEKEKKQHDFNIWLKTSQSPRHWETHREKWNRETITPIDNRIHALEAEKDLYKAELKKREKVVLQLAEYEAKKKAESIPAQAKRAIETIKRYQKEAKAVIALAEILDKDIETIFKPVLNASHTLALLEVEAAELREAGFKVESFPTSVDIPEGLQAAIEKLIGHEMNRVKLNWKARGIIASHKARKLDEAALEREEMLAVG
jgi:hypothetical protein